MADNKFFELFNDIDDKYIKEAEQIASGPDMYIEYVPGNISKRKMFFAGAGILAACATLVIGIVKLPGIVFGLRSGREWPDSGVSSTGTSLPNGETALELRGTPIPENELEEFDIDGLADGYRQTFSKELTKVLESIGSDAAGVYCKARTLADLQTHILNVDIIATDKARAKREDNMRATIALTLRYTDPGFSDSKYDTREFYETGYSYDSFCRAFRDIFCEESADYLIMNSRYDFCDCGGGLYTHDTYSMEGDSLGPVFTDYEVITNTDNEVVFNTVRYFDYADDWLTDEVREPYDSANKDTYLNREGKRFVMTNTNRLIKENGIWKAYDIYYVHDQTRPVTFEDRRPDITDKLVLQGEPFPESAHTDFDYGKTLSEYTGELKKDEGLTALLEQIGDSGFAEQYYKARTLAEILAQNDDVYFNVREIGTILSFRDDYNQECDRYLEMGLKYDSFMKTLKETFGDKTIDYMLERGIFYNYNNSLCRSTKSFSENPLLVHNDYRLTFKGEDEIIFDTLCYHIRPEEFDGFLFRWEKQPYDPSKKTEYDVTKITNRFVKDKETGKWKAEEICFLGDLSSVGEMVETNEIPVSDNIIVTGTPLHESELEDFTYEKTLENYRKILANDEELTAVLNQINNPDFTESYYRARTLADMLWFVEGTELEPSEKIRVGHEPAVIQFISPINSFLPFFEETGYKYGGFDSAFRDVFSGDNAEKLLKRVSIFTRYNGELYTRDLDHYNPYVDYYLAHIGYELKTNTDSEIVIDSVCYFIDEGYLTTWTKPTFHPENIDSYIIKRVSNRFVKENGKWKAAELCTANGVSSLFDLYDPANQETVTIGGKEYTIMGNPSVSCSSFDYSGLYNAQFGIDKQDLRDFLDKLDNPEAADAYLRAAAVTDGFYGGQFVSGVQGSAWIDDGDNKYYETGFYDSDFFGALRDIFTVEASTAIPERSGVFFSYNGELYQSYYLDSALGDRNVFEIDYELVKNTNTEIEFNTIIKYVYVSDYSDGIVAPDFERRDCIKNRIVYQEGLVHGGWRVDEMCILNFVSSNDPLPQTIR